jgi:uncharacterized membrane-anchored protein YhcB (DUF1043 family)
MDMQNLIFTIGLLAGVVVGIVVGQFMPQTRYNQTAYDRA